MSYVILIPFLYIAAAIGTIDCAKRHDLDKREKAVFITTMLVFPPFGILLYLYRIRPKELE